MPGSARRTQVHEGIVWPPPEAPEAGAVKAERQAAEAEESEESELEVLLETRPLGLELCEGEGGSGAAVEKVEGVAADAGVEPGSAILRVNDVLVEKLPMAEIKNRLDHDSMPLLVGLRLPPSLHKAGRTTKRQKSVSVCTANCRGSYRVVTEAIEQLGWQEVETDSRDASVVWLEHSDPTDGLAPVQTMSRIEAFLYFCRKARLAKSLNRWVEELPDDFAFSPKTWVLPDDCAELESAMAKGKDTYIAKPTAGCQGKGILLAKKWKDLECIAQKSKMVNDFTGRQRSQTEYVVQRYISQPLLIDSLKFDLRLYVIVTSVVPLRAYLFKEGLARFCTVPYQPPKEANLHDTCMHLTNFAVNKKSKDFQPSEGIAQHDEGSKRSASSVFEQIEQLYGTRREDLWQKVLRLVANTLMAMRPDLLEYYVHERPRPLHPLGPKGFQIIGLDVILDGDTEPRLLELNANPSLSVMQPGGAQESGGSPAEADSAAQEPAAAATSAGPAAAAAGRRLGRGSLRRRTKSRLGIAEGRKERGGAKEPHTVAELDLAVKRELVCQALLLVRPAPKAKAIRLRRQWLRSGRSNGGTAVPLDDSGAWTLGMPPTKAEEIRLDAPQSCPALEAVDFESFAAPRVAEYAQAHLALYRCWLRACGQSQETLGQVGMLKLLERGAMIGPGALFPDRVAAQLWMSREWRDVAEGAFGLNLPQFVVLAGKLGCRLLGNQGASGADDEEAGPSSVDGVIEFAASAILCQE